LGTLFSFIVLLIIVILIVATTLDFFISNTQIKNSLILNPNLKFENFIIFGSISIPDSINYCSNSLIDSIGFNGDIIKSFSFNKTTNMCTGFWNCTNCNIVGFSQQICYNFNDNNQPVFTNSFDYDIKLKSVIQDYFYIMNGTFITSDQIIYGKSPSYIYISIYKSLYKTLFANNFSPLIRLVDYFSPIITDNNSFGLFGLINGFLFQTEKSLIKDVNSFSICYSFELSPAIYFINQDFKQKALNYFGQIIALILGTISFFGLIYQNIDRLFQNILYYLNLGKKKFKKNKINDQIDVNLKNNDQNDLNLIIKMMLI
jgi:hypothetical protein